MLCYKLPKSSSRSKIKNVEERSCMIYWQLSQVPQKWNTRAG